MLARLFVFFGGLFVLALTAALIGPYFIVWTSYRADFEREASAILGRKVKVEGAATARLLPFPSVTFTDVSVGAGEGEPPMTIETFSMDAELAPFMSGEILIFDMRLEKPRATIEVAEDGTIDWTVRPSTPFQPSRISLEKLTVTEGQVTIRHAVSGRTHVLSGIDATASARTLAGPWHVQGSMSADGMQTALIVTTGAVDETGAMRLKVRAEPLRYALNLETEGNVRIEKGAAKYTGTFNVAAQKPKSTKARAKETEPGNRLKGRFSVDHSRLDVAEFRFETGPLDDPYAAEGSAFIEFGAEPRFSIKADGAQVRLDETAAAPTDSSLTLAARLAALEDAIASFPKPTIPGTIDVKLPAIVAGDTTIRDIRLSAEPATGGWAIRSLAATLPGRTTLEADGFLSTVDDFGFDGSLLLAIAQPSGFAAWVAKDVEDAIRRLPAAGFSAKVSLTPRQQSFRDLELILGKARFRGEIASRQPLSARPSAQLRLEGGELDMDGLAAFAALFVNQEGMIPLWGHNIDLQMKAGPVSLGGLTADTVDTAIRLGEDTVEVDRLSIGGLAGATVSATGTIKDFASEPSGKLDASIIAVDLTPLISQAAAQFPDNAILSGLARRAAGYPSLFRDAELDLVASLASGDEGAGEIAVSAHGTTGGSSFAATLSGQGSADALEDATVLLSFNARNNDAAALLALYGLPDMQSGILGAGYTDLSMRGPLSGGMETTMNLTSEGFAASFEGVVSARTDGPAVKGRLRLDAEDLEPWLMASAVALPGMGTGMRATFQADADYEKGLLVLGDLNATLGENALAGELNAEIRESLPHLTGALSVDAVDLDPVAVMLVGDAALAGELQGWPSTPFREKAGVPFTAELDMTASALSAGAFATAYDAHFTARLSTEGLQVSDLSAKLYDGDLTGLFELKNTDGSGLFSGQFKLSEADLAAAIPGNGLSGRGDFAATFSSSGKSVGGMVAALSGSGTASLKGLSISGLNPNAFPALIARADAIGRDINAARVAEFAPAIAGNGAFNTPSAEVPFTVAGGVFRAPPITLQNPAATLSAELRYDLNTEIAVVDGSMTYAAGDEALAGSDPTLRFRLDGRPGEAERVLDTEPLTQFLTQRALEREQARVEAMQAALLEKQRLRREVRNYQSLQAERDRVAEEKRRAAEEVQRAAEEAARLKAEAEARASAEAEEEARRAAEEAAARQKAEEEARRKQAEEAERRQSEQEVQPRPRGDTGAQATPAGEDATRASTTNSVDRQGARPRLVPETLDGFMRALQGE